MFGMTKRRGLFGGGNGIVATPEQEAESARLADYFRGKGYPVDPQEAPSPVQGSFGIGGTINPEAQPARKTGFFGQGGAGRAIAGTIGDVLLQRGGLAPIYAPTMKARQESLLAEQERETERADWLWKKQWERDNPQPVNNDTERDYQFIAQTIGKEAANQYLRNLGDPTVSMTLPGNRVYSGPRSGLGQALGQGSANIDAEPTSEDGFDYTPGPGGRANPSNWKKSGGSTSQASGPFQR